MEKINCPPGQNNSFNFFKRLCFGSLKDIDEEEEIPKMKVTKKKGVSIAGIDPGWHSP